MKTAIFVDGAYFLRRFRNIYKTKDYRNPVVVTDTMYRMCIKHLKTRYGIKSKLYRLFFYDCPPLEKRVHYPISNQCIVLGQTDEAKFRKAIHQHLVTKRKVALRLGRLDEKNGRWVVKDWAMDALMKGNLDWPNLTDDHFRYHAKQAGVDMMIGTDIASVADGKHVSQMVLVAGDSDFVPAAKLARRSGIDFILDPMWNHIHDDLMEHIDGLHSTSPKPY